MRIRLLELLTQFSNFITLNLCKGLNLKRHTICAQKGQFQYFTSQSLRAVRVLFSPMASRWGLVVAKSLSGLYHRNCKVHEVFT